MDLVPHQDVQFLDDAFSRYRDMQRSKIRTLVRAGRLTEVGECISELEREIARHQSHRAMLLCPELHGEHDGIAAGSGARG